MRSTTTYLNPWESGPLVYEVESRPVEYRGFLVYRHHAGRFDTVRDGVCQDQRWTLRGARRAIDAHHEGRASPWGFRIKPPREPGHEKDRPTP